jgi:hypothetical protein
MDRERDVERRSTEAPQGAMTESTGSLTPDRADEEFVPAETAGINDPGRTHDLIVSARRRRQHHTGRPDRPGELMDAGTEMPPNDRDGGYGSQHGLAGGDPAYRVEERPVEPSEAEPVAQEDEPTAGSDLGGDEQRAPEEEHF